MLFGGWSRIKLEIIPEEDKVYLVGFIMGCTGSSLGLILSFKWTDLWDLVAAFVMAGLELRFHFKYVEAEVCIWHQCYGFVGVQNWSAFGSFPCNKPFQRCHKHWMSICASSQTHTSQTWRRMFSKQG